MTTLYDIDRALREKVDPETGEIVDLEGYDLLEGDRARKIANCIKLMREWVLEAAALKETAAKLGDPLLRRARTLENEAARLKAYAMSYVQPGEEFSDPQLGRIRITGTEFVEVGPEAAIDEWPSEYVRTRPPEPDKKAIRQALKDGKGIPSHVSLRVRVGYRLG